MTLLVVPVVYSLLDGLVMRLSRRELPGLSGDLTGRENEASESDSA